MHSVVDIASSFVGNMNGKNTALVRWRCRHWTPNWNIFRWDSVSPRHLIFSSIYLSLSGVGFLCTPVCLFTRRIILFTYAGLVFNPVGCVISTLWSDCNPSSDVVNGHMLTMWLIVCCCRTHRQLIWQGPSCVDLQGTRTDSNVHRTKWLWLLRPLCCAWMHGNIPSCVSTFYYINIVSPVVR